MIMKSWLNIFILLLLLIISIAMCPLGECTDNGKDGKAESKPSKLADFTPQKHDGQANEKTGINKSTDAGPSTILDKEAMQKLKKKADDMALKFKHFSIDSFFKKEIPFPKTNIEYKELLDDAIDHMNLQNDDEQTIDRIIELIREGLKGRRLLYIRLIGSGSMRQHNHHFNYDQKAREKYETIMKLLKKRDKRFPKIYIQVLQIFAVYQLAFVKQIAEYFNIIPSNVTVEDMHLVNTERRFLHEVLGYTSILGDNGPEGNLVKIPSQVEKMGQNDVTLVIMINCGLDFSINLLKSYYGDKLSQLILLESSMDGGKPLPQTFWTKNALNLNASDQRDARIHYFN